MINVLMVSAVVPSLLLIWYFHARDAYPEPWKVLWATFGLGVLTVVPVLLVALPTDKLLGTFANPAVNGLCKAVFTAAIPEEWFKFMVVWLYCSRHAEFDEPMDGVVYGAVASLGFATLENVLYVTQGGLGVALLRALTAVPGHAFMGAIMGYYVGQAKFRPVERSGLLLKAYFIPMLFHTLYDFPLLSLKTTAGAHASRPEWLALLLPITLVAFIVEWVWTVRIVRRLRSEQMAFMRPQPGFAQQPYAPQPGFAQQPCAPQPGFVPYGGYTPYAVAPRYSPLREPPQSSPVAGALLVVAGVMFSAVGGLMLLGAGLLLASGGGREHLAPGVTIITGVLFGLLPLSLGLLLFGLGIKKLNG